jgi:transcriptional regulator with XRE-family HTH domain
MTDISATRVRVLRARLGISQEALGERIGVSQATIDRLERGVQQETKPQTLLLDMLQRELPPETGEATSHAA